MSLAALAASLRDSRGVAHKRDLDAVVATLASALMPFVLVAFAIWLLVRLSRRPVSA